MPATAPVAIVHDYLTQRGGAERVVLAMARAFPDAIIHTSLYEPATTFPEFEGLDVRPLWTNRVALLRADHRRGLPLYPLAFGTATVDAEVVLCSSSGFAHGVRSTGRKVVYCHSPARWLYTEAASYLAGWPAPIRAATRSIAPQMRAWDRRGMRSAHRVLANSTAVASHIREAYGIEAEVVAPPAGIDAGGPQRPVPGIQRGFVLSVGRLLSYKNVDALVGAMADLPASRLVVVGDGPERARLAAMAGPNVTFLGEVADDELRWLYASCVGVASAAYEDYGLTPLEAAAHGKPAAALRFGGFLDTVLEGQSGVFFDEPTPAAIAPALGSLGTTPWCPEVIVAHAAAHGENEFGARLLERVTGSAL